MTSSRELPHLGPLRLPEEAPERALLRRVALAVGLILAVTALQWLDRDGLRDNVHPDRPIGFIDVLYFTVVSLTTVGYGDITPVTDNARLINAVVMTPIRIFLWVLFLGTAYELTVLRLRWREERQMKGLHDRLSQHVIVCGYGVKGRAIVDELLAHGQAPDQIVAIDESEAAVTAAAHQGLVALQGDASSEDLLRAANVEDASTVLVAPNRDDASVLISLTVRSLAPEVHLVAAAREEENVKLLYGAGANLVVAPSVSGGRLMGAAVRQHAVPQFLEDLLSFGEGLAMTERIVQPDEAGRLASELPDLDGALILGAARPTALPLSPAPLLSPPAGRRHRLSDGRGRMCGGRRTGLPRRDRCFIDLAARAPAPIRWTPVGHQKTKARCAGGRRSVGRLGNIGGLLPVGRLYPVPGLRILETGSWCPSTLSENGPLSLRFLSPAARLSTPLCRHCRATVRITNSFVFGTDRWAFPLASRCGT